jgi:RND family efflux transporter MFP subunit
MSDRDLSELRIDRKLPGLDGRRHRSAWWSFAGLMVVLGAAGAAFSLFSSAPAVETAAVSVAYPYQSVTLLNAAGYVVAQRKAAVASKATGRLEWLGVVEGSVVKQDEIIARLESRDVRAAADQARANVAVARGNIVQAEAELNDADAAVRRARALVAQRFLAQSALDTAEARANKAKAALTSARAALQASEAHARAAQVAVEQTLIRAPFDGVVLTKQANVGDNITPFSAAADTKGAVVTMADMATLEVEADVSESNLGKIKVGQPCEIQLDAFPDQRFRGAVSRIVPTVDRAKATVMTKVRFLDRDPRVLPEMSAKVAFLEREIDAEQRRPFTVVHPDAVVSRDGQSVIFVVHDNRVNAVPVRTGDKLGDALAIAGLAQPVQAGDRVVLRPDGKLRGGAEVKPAQKP